MSYHRLSTTITWLIIVLLCFPCNKSRRVQKSTFFASYLGAVHINMASSLKQRVAIWPCPFLSLYATNSTSSSRKRCWNLRIMATVWAVQCITSKCSGVQWSTVEHDMMQCRHDAMQLKWSAMQLEHNASNAQCNTVQWMQLSIMEHDTTAM